jgi:hypothetical protein
MCSIQVAAGCEALFHRSTGKIDAYFLDIVFRCLEVEIHPLLGNSKEFFLLSFSQWPTWR